MFTCRYTNKNSIVVQKRFVELVDSLARTNNSSWLSHVNKSDLDRLLSVALINNLSNLVATTTSNNQQEQTDQSDLLVANACSLIRHMNANTLRLLVDLLATQHDDYYDYSVDDNDESKTTHISNSIRYTLTYHSISYLIV